MADEMNPTWRIEREPASRIFLVLVDAIRLDPKLSKVRTWIAPGRYGLLDRGLATRLTDPEFAITAAMCPAISFWPEPRDGQVRDNHSQQAELSVSVKVYLPGIDPLDVLDYWGRVQRALLRNNLPDGSNLRVRLAAAGSDGTPVRIDQPTISRALDPENAAVQVGEGSFSITYEIPEGED